MSEFRSLFLLIPSAGLGPDGGKAFVPGWHQVHSNKQRSWLKFTANKDGVWVDKDIENAKEVLK